MAAPISVACGAAVALLGLSVLAGWAFGVPRLETVSAGGVSMKANTALAFVLAGLGLLSVHAAERWTARLRQVAAAAAAVVAAIGILTLLEYLAGRGLGIDQLLFTEPQGTPGTAAPGRMAVASALGITLAGASLGAIWARRPRIGQVAAAGLVAITLSAVLGDAYGVPLDRPWGTTSVAPHTIAGIGVLGIGLLLARADRGPVGGLFADEPGGLMARRLLLAAFVALPGLGGLRLVGQDAGLYGEETGIGLMVLASLVILTVAVGLTAHRLNVLAGQRLSALRRLAAGEQELRRTLEHLMRVRDTERRRLAMEVHDDALPALSAVSLQLELARDVDDGAAVRTRLERAERELRGVTARLRQLTFDLRPEALGREGLGAALRQRLDRMRELTGVDYRLRDGVGGVVAPDAEAILYRIAVEALNNVVRHAAATSVDVRLTRRDAAVELVIRDDGVGMESVAPRDGHLGLRTMAERAQLAGGGFEVLSAPGQGTTVVCWAPLEPRVSAQALA